MQKMISPPSLEYTNVPTDSISNWSTYSTTMVMFRGNARQS